ncbi:alpha-xenorhabdolysin family binary toxin subunit B [Pseudomonas sp. UMAB-08]|uniref:alpha-xenorhabdolysin family binary toxin subunit B n=1 Tax=Pseudomonas sp. UMAB-08 TaxID=1365375 RepID=UPI001C56E485|nr:alpha-xenorhabdolysin family binary toxin subunit B [Pseudomonas sp. UMAB-08]
MTVHMLDTPYQLSQPDLEVVRVSRAEIDHHVIALGNIYLPVLKEKLQALRKEISLTDEYTLNVLTGVPVRLESEGMGVLFTSIEKLSKEVPAEEIKAAIEEYTNELSGLMDQSVSAVKQYASDLDDRVTNLNAVMLSDNNDQMLELEQSIEATKNLLTVEVGAIAALEATAELLKAALDDMEKLTFSDKLKPLVESLQELTKIDPKNPALGSIQAGITGVKNILDLASDGVNYTHMIEARSVVQERLKGRRKKVLDLEDQIETSSTRIQQLTTVGGLDNHKARYVQEITKIGQALSTFVNSNLPNSAEVVTQRAERFAIQAKALGTYLHTLRKAWQS